MRLYIPFDEPLEHVYFGTTYHLPANGDIDLPDDVAVHVLRRHDEAGVVAYTGGTPETDAADRARAEELFTAHLKRKLGGPSGASLSLYSSAAKRGLIGGPPVPPPTDVVDTKV